MNKNQKIIIISAAVSAMICVVLIIVFFQRMKQTIMGVVSNNYFTFYELYHSNTAIANGINNTPTPEARLNLLKLRENILNPAREKLGSAIWVNSGYRCPELNAEVGGSSTSDHMTGCAADLDTRSKKKNQELFAILVEMGNFDQLIWEGGGEWIHVSYRQSGNRGQILAQEGSRYPSIKNNWQTYIA